VDVEPKASLVLGVPPLARTARLLTQALGWTIHYQWLFEDDVGHIEIRRIDSGALRSDHVDPTDATAVVAYVERRMKAEDFDVTRIPVEDKPAVARWTIEHRTTDPRATVANAL
jgi:hypothetical protein